MQGLQQQRKLFYKNFVYSDESDRKKINFDFDFLNDFTWVFRFLPKAFEGAK